MLHAAGLIAGVVILTLLAAFLLGAIVILGVHLVADIRQLLGQLFPHKQSSNDNVYQEINVCMIIVEHQHQQQ